MMLDCKSVGAVSVVSDGCPSLVLKVARKNTVPGKRRK